MKESELPLWKGKRYQKFLIIQNHDLHAGFSALLIYVLNGIRKARAINAIPVIDFNSSNCPYFYEASKGSSIWDYYFEPVSPFDYQQIAAWLKAGKLSQKAVQFIGAQEAANTHHYDPDRLATFWAWNVPEDKRQWMEDKRKLGRQYVHDFIHPKSHILQKVKAFKTTWFQAEFIIGVHIRGTDFAYAKPTPIETYLKEIEQLLHNTSGQDYQIFLATDQQQYLDTFKERYGKKVIYLQASRSDNHIAPFRFDHISGYDKGEEVLLDMLLLSACHHIVKGPAAIGEMALWFNNNDNITDFAILSEFNQKRYSQQKSAYAQLNIGNKSNIKLKYHKARENMVRKIVSSRIGMAFYSRFNAVRKLLKH